MNISTIGKGLIAGVSGSRRRCAYLEVVNLLHKLKQGNIPVVLQFEGGTAVYTATVCALNAHHRVFVVNNLQPQLPATRQLFVRGKQVRFQLGDRSEPIQWQSRFIEPLMALTDAGYLMRIPNRLGEIGSIGIIARLTQRLTAAVT